MPGWIAPAITGIASLIGGHSANQMQREESARNRRFQERMSSTAHQREVKDLRAAGLNPILSASRGASSPSGNMANQSDAITPAVSTALQAMMVEKQLENLTANTRNTNADATLKEAEFPKKGFFEGIWDGINKFGSSAWDLTKEVWNQDVKSSKPGRGVTDKNPLIQWKRNKDGKATPTPNPQTKKPLEIEITRGLARRKGESMSAWKKRVRAYEKRSRKR